jgi:ParB family chromosome partitioning protein
LSTDDKATHEIALRENLDRVDLHPLEEGEAYVSLLETQAFTSHEGIAKGFGKPKSRITECIGYTRLPEETKQLLLKHNVKNRSLLRNLLNMPTEQHAQAIEESLGKEEVLAGQEAAAVTEKAPKAKKEKKEPVPFAIDCSEKGIAVPSFKWKVGEGTERLAGYLEALKKLVAEIEEKGLNR